MSLYPSLEDMKVDQMARAQVQVMKALPTAPASAPAPSQGETPYPLHPTEVPSAPGNFGALYPSLQEYMGLELTPEMIAANMPQYSVAVLQPNEVATNTRPPDHTSRIVAPLSGKSVGLARAEVTHGIRQVVLCKDQGGLVGLRVRAINKGIFVCLVRSGSPAAMAGLRFGDQILQINGENLAGYTMDKVHSIFKKADRNNIILAVRDRPFERTLTMHKDSSGHIGFQFKEGKITALIKDSSAARNGLLTEHNLLEINGQNVVGLKDKDITKIIDEGGNIITVTIMPTFLYDHIMKHMAESIVKKQMDHSLSDL